MAELKSVVMEHRLQAAEKHQKSVNRISLHENVQLLQELQVSQQDSRAATRQLEAVQSELRDLQTRYKILESRARGAAGGALAGESSGAWTDVEGGLPTTPRGSVSMAGRVAPSHPSSAYPAASPQPTSNLRSSWAASGTSPSSRPTSAVAVASSSRPASASYRASGGAVSGNIARGSPARVLHELIGVERERVTELMAQLQLTSADLERQREAAAAAGNALRSAIASEGGDILAIEEGDEEGRDEEEGGEARSSSVGYSGVGSGNAAKAIKRWAISSELLPVR